VAGDDDAVTDLVEGETNLVEAIAAADRRLLELAYLHGGIKTAISDLQTRISRYEAQEERIRAAVLNAMSECGLKKLELATGTLSLGKCPDSVRIVSEADLPTQYMVEKLELKPDKKALLEALKGGARIAGAELANGAPRLSIRRK
jgi:hypothetical protein